MTAPLLGCPHENTLSVGRRYEWCQDCGVLGEIHDGGIAWLHPLRRRAVASGVDTLRLQALAQEMTRVAGDGTCNVRAFVSLWVATLEAALTAQPWRCDVDADAALRCMADADDQSNVIPSDGPSPCGEHATVHLCQHHAQPQRAGEDKGVGLDDETISNVAACRHWIETQGGSLLMVRDSEIADVIAWARSFPSLKPAQRDAQGGAVVYLASSRNSGSRPTSIATITRSACPDARPGSRERERERDAGEGQAMKDPRAPP